METLIRRSTLAALALTGAALTANAEDLTIVASVTRNNDAPTTRVTYVSNERMRSSSENGEFIVDFATGNLTFIDALKQRLNVMDSTAFSLCLDNNVPILVFNLDDPHAIRKAVLGAKIGTLVHH